MFPTSLLPTMAASSWQVSSALRNCLNILRPGSVGALCATCAHMHSLRMRQTVLTFLEDLRMVP